MKSPDILLLLCWAAQLHHRVSGADSATDTWTSPSPLPSSSGVASQKEDLMLVTAEQSEEDRRSALSGPKQLQVVKATQRSILLEWQFDAVPEEHVTGYRVHYIHDVYNDVKTILKSKPSYEIKGLEPFRLYQIWVEAIVNGSLTQASEPIMANTDVDQPSPPMFTNLTCYDTGQIYLEWLRPKSFYHSVDYYYIYHRPTSEHLFKSIPIQADAKEQVQRFVMTELAGDVRYVVKICAGTRSLSNPNQTWLGEASEEREIFLPRFNCKPSFFESELTGELSAGMIVGAVCALFFLIAAIMGFIVWRRYFKAAYYYLDEPQRSQVPREPPNWEEELSPEGQRGAVTLDDFAHHVSSLHVDSDIGFSKEYEEIQKFCAKNGPNLSHEHSTHADNKCKNRYLNIVAYDHTRVKLSVSPGQKKSCDYINANYIDGFRRCNAYIGTQGPLEHTFEAFWRMIWEQNVYVIVMITNLMERGRRKCDRYWPKEDSETYGHVEVSLVKEECMANYTVRWLKLKHLKDTLDRGAHVNTLKRKKGQVSERDIQQFHYTSWPDHGVPCHPLPVLTYIRKSSEANPPDGGAIVVHCSAGVGRTGTYIAIDSMLQQMNTRQQVNVYGFLKHIRCQRNHLVQTEEQYVFIHDALLEATRSGNTEVARDQLSEYIANLLVVAHGQSSRPLDDQFQLLAEFKPSEYQYMSARMACNRSKNRDGDIIPVESSRIPLAPKPGVEGSDYINASWLPGHNKLKEFILAQHPVEECREDFWRMLWDHNAQTVVLLSSVKDTELTAFWPDKDQDYDLEAFRVRFVEEAVHQGHSTYDFVVSSQHDDYELSVRIIYCPDWPHNVNNWSQVFSVLKVVQDWHLEYQDGPLVVVDKNGSCEGATFAALTTLCKQLESFNSVDVYQVAKLYHYNRPGIWKSASDLLYLYEAMQELVTSKQANPLHETGQLADGPVPHERVSVNASAAVSPCSETRGRGYSSSATDWFHANGLVKTLNGHGVESATTTTTTTTATTDDEHPGGSTRRHSLPPNVSPMGETRGSSSQQNGCATILRHHSDDMDEDLDDISETAALTSTPVCATDRTED